MTGPQRGYLLPPTYLNIWTEMSWPRCAELPLDVAPLVCPGRNSDLRTFSTCWGTALTIQSSGITRGCRRRIQHLQPCSVEKVVWCSAWSKCFSLAFAHPDSLDGICIYGIILVSISTNRIPDYFFYHKTRNAMKNKQNELLNCCNISKSYIYTV